MEFKTSLMVLVLVVGSSLVGCDNAAKDLTAALNSSVITAGEKPADRKEQAVAAAEAVIYNLLGQPNEKQHNLLERALLPVLENQVANEAALFGGSNYENSLKLQERILKLVQKTNLLEELKKLADEPAAE